MVFLLVLLHLVSMTQTWSLHSSGYVGQTCQNMFLGLVYSWPARKWITLWITYQLLETVSMLLVMYDTNQVAKMWVCIFQRHKTISMQHSQWLWVRKKTTFFPTLHSSHSQFFWGVGMRPCVPRLQQKWSKFSLGEHAQAILQQWLHRLALATGSTEYWFLQAVLFFYLAFSISKSQLCPSNIYLQWIFLA